MKPVIRKCHGKREARWSCSGGEVFVVGRDPEQAYRAWLHMRQAASLSCAEQIALNFRNFGTRTKTTKG